MTSWPFSSQVSSHITPSLRLWIPFHQPSTHRLRQSPNRNHSAASSIHQFPPWSSHGIPFPHPNSPPYGIPFVYHFTCQWSPYGLGHPVFPFLSLHFTSFHTDTTQVPLQTPHSCSIVSLVPSIQSPQPLHSLDSLGSPRSPASAAPNRRRSGRLLTAVPPPAGLTLFPENPAAATDPVYMSRKIRKFRTDKFDT